MDTLRNGGTVPRRINLGIERREINFTIRLLNPGNRTSHINGAGDV
jgi:hypothetical protein